MSSLCQNRLQEERKQWRKDHPFGFFAKPRKSNGSLDLMTWDAGIPGKAGTLWDGGIYPVTIYFTQDYPTKPPKCQLPAGFYHPNVYPSGTICLSILNESEDWSPAITLKSILLGIQELLNDPNPNSPAQTDAYQAFQKNRQMYEKKVLQQAKRYTSTL